MHSRKLIAVVVCLAVTAQSHADDRREFTPPPIQVPDGFTVELAAAAPLVRYPMMACFDERGRLFIAETHGNNLDKEELIKASARFIRMLEDRDGDGVFDKSTIFADKLVMPEGALWHQGSLYVLSSPYLWRLTDTDDDGVANQREKIAGAMEFNGKANQHGAYLGPNGRLCFSGAYLATTLSARTASEPRKGPPRASSRAAPMAMTWRSSATAESIRSKLPSLRTVNSSRPAQSSTMSTVTTTR